MPRCWKTVTLVAVLATVTVACRERREPAVPSSPAATPVDPAALSAKLAQADLVDGASDHVVARCPGCSLVMKGSAEHSVEVAGYSLHFCSEVCKEDFSKNLEGNVLALEIDE